MEVDTKRFVLSRLGIYLGKDKVQRVTSTEVKSYFETKYIQ